ncbi:DNA mismatch repair ATPase msh1 [Asimina triloba]
MQDDEPLEGINKMEIIGLSPYWFDAVQGNAILNTITMHSLFLLTGPNGGGKSSLLRSICAAALLGICGLMVPAESAVIPHFDSIMLHMKSYDSPADGKSSFQIEMSEIRSIINGATRKSLVLMDEICRGTEMSKGTCIAGSVVETLDCIGCLGIVSTHLHGIFDLPLTIKNTIYKAMGTETLGGRTRPTWKLVDGICRESLAFETAIKEGVPEAIIRRAEELYCSTRRRLFYENDMKLGNLCSNSQVNDLDKGSDSLRRISVRSTPVSEAMNPSMILQKEVKSVIMMICQKRLTELYKQMVLSDFAEATCIIVGAREQPPPSTIGVSSVYVLLQPGKQLYVGQSDDLVGRLRAHRSKESMQNVVCLYIVVPGKSVASELETLLINQLPHHGFRLSNVADGKHRNFGTANLCEEPLTLF